MQNRATFQTIKKYLTCPGKRRHVVTPLIVADSRWFKSPYVGVVSLSVRKQMSYRASLSMQNVSSVFSTNWWTDKVALYGSTTVSDTCTRSNLKKKWQKDVPLRHQNFYAPAKRLTIFTFVELNPLLRDILCIVFFKLFQRQDVSVIIKRT